jgi:hypothetical protein
MNNIKRIVVFGCSYATGEELLYHELDYRLIAIRNANTDPRVFFNAVESNTNYQEQYSGVIKKQYELAWPAKLAKLMNVECVNFAESGNSMQKMLWQFLNYKEQLTDTDLVIFSQTKPDRNVFFHDKPTSFQIASMLGLIGVGKNGNASTVIDSDTDRSMLKWFTDDRIIWDDLMVLMSIGYFKNTYNIRIVPAMRSSEYKLKEYNTIVYNMCKVLQSQLFLGSKTMDDFKSNDSLLWGHPTLAVHIQYADYLFKELTSV